MRSPSIAHGTRGCSSTDFDLAHAVPGTLTLAPSLAMLGPLERDYDAMTGMIMGAVPRLAEVIDPISVLERRLNERT